MDQIRWYHPESKHVVIAWLIIKIFAAISLLHNHRPVALIIWQWKSVNRWFCGSAQFLNHVKNIKHEWILSKVCVDNFSRCLKSNCRIQLGREFAKGYSKVMSILGVKTCVVNEVHAASDDIVGGEGWTVRLPVARGAKRVAIVTVVAIGLLIPALKERNFSPRNSLLTFCHCGEITVANTLIIYLVICSFWRLMQSWLSIRCPCIRRALWR